LRPLDEKLERGDDVKRNMMLTCLALPFGQAGGDGSGLVQAGLQALPQQWDDYYCKTADGLKDCNNYRIDGRVKTCRAEEK
jgi:hypothetical protein